MAFDGNDEQKERHIRPLFHGTERSLNWMMTLVLPMLTCAVVWGSVQSRVSALEEGQKLTREEQSAQRRDIGGSQRDAARMEAKLDMVLDELRWRKRSEGTEKP